MNEDPGADIHVRQLKQEPGKKNKRSYKKIPKRSRWRLPSSTTPRDADQVGFSAIEPSTSKTMGISEPTDTNLTKTSNQADIPANPPSRPHSDLENNKDVCLIFRIEDDQNPMIECDTCKQWYHFKCQNIQQRPNEDTSFNSNRWPNAIT